jgi:hypothetical protein
VIGEPTGELFRLALPLAIKTVAVVKISVA